MTNRRQTPPPSSHVLFALALVFFGLLLPFLSAAFSPPVASQARAPLPTADVRVPTAQRHVTLEQPASLASLPTAIPPTLPPEPPPADTQAAPLPVAVGPTPTITPAPLGTVGEPPAATTAPPEPSLPTLIPTAQPAAPPTAAPNAVPLAGAVPILMYHYIRWVDANVDPLGYNLSITPDDFRQQLAWLAANGYHTVRMDTLTRCMAGEVLCPPQPVALTFDDGYDNAFTEALPVLQQYGMTATFYIITAPVGQPGYMNWEQIAALRDAGMEIGAHTVNHYDLTSLDSGTMSYEIAQSKTDLEQHLGISVVSFCYPTGLYNWSVEDQVRAAGFANATTTRWDGDYSDIMALPRRRIAGGTSLDGFAAIVGG